jgi:hypothetical protein
MDNKNLHIKIVIFTFLLILFIWTLSFHYLEKWSYIDSFYFSVATMTTVWYWDLVPTSDFSKIFLSIYSLISITLYISIAVVFWEWYIEKLLLKHQNIKKNIRRYKWK